MRVCCRDFRWIYARYSNSICRREVNKIALFGYLLSGSGLDFISLH